MSEILHNRALQFNAAGAQPSRNTSGECTVTVHATYTDPDGYYSSTEQVHLTMGAALQLREALDAALP